MTFNVSLAMANLDATKKIDAKPALKLNATIAKQGDFFEATIENVKARPTVWFNTNAFKTFKVADRTYRALVPVENLTKVGSYSVLARSGSWEKRIPVKVIDNGKGVQHITLTDDKDGISPTAKELREIGRGNRSISNDKLWDGKFLLPSKARKSSPFGVKRSYNNGPVESYHKGLDFAANHGSPVLAPADGKVVVEGHVADGFQLHGNTVILDHGHGVTSIYMHLSKISVKKGSLVHKGQKIGEVGHTGISTGPHLHWGVYLYGTSVDPEHFLNQPVN